MSEQMTTVEKSITVVLRTAIIRNSGVRYQVIAPDGEMVFDRSVLLVRFGSDKAHRAGGHAFQQVAQEQERIAHELGGRMGGPMTVLTPPPRDPLVEVLDAIGKVMLVDDRESALDILREFVEERDRTWIEAIGGSRVSESKWIAFEEQPPFNKNQRTKRWTVTTKPSAFGSDFGNGEWLGDVRWYAPWRKYAFQPAAAGIFEQDCLRDIANFVEEQTSLRREERAREKEAGR